MSDLVMVIEDEKEIRDLLRYNLERAGFRFDPVVSQYNQSGELFRIEGHCQSSCTTTAISALSALIAATTMTVEDLNLVKRGIPVLLLARGIVTDDEVEERAAEYQALERDPVF